MEKLTVGITGMVGFVGSHLRDRLIREKDILVPPFEDSYFDDFKRLKEYLSKCDIIVHLAAMNRGDDDEIYQVNVELVQKLVSSLEQLDAKPHVIFSSSTQVDRDNPYGRSKREGACILEQWAKSTQAPLTVMIIPNIFGDKGKPFYNSVIATFCYQVTHGEEPKIIVDGEIDLIFIGELTELMFEKIKNPPENAEVIKIKSTGKAKVSEILALLEGFKEHYYDKRIVPEFKNDFQRNLYNTFITYMEESDFAQYPEVHSDSRGSLFEIIKQTGAGQVFFSSTKPGVTRGNHYHTRKMEKFCVIKGEAVIRLRRIGTNDIIEYKVSGDKPVSVEMPIFYTHNITNVGKTELLTLFWTNELFDPKDPDTFYEEV